MQLLPFALFLFGVLFVSAAASGWNGPGGMPENAYWQQPEGNAHAANFQQGQNPNVHAHNNHYPVAQTQGGHNQANFLRSKAGELHTAITSEKQKAMTLESRLKVQRSSTRSKKEENAKSRENIAELFQENQDLRQQLDWFKTQVPEPKWQPEADAYFQTQEILPPSYAPPSSDPWNTRPMPQTSVAPMNRGLAPRQRVHYEYATPDLNGGCAKNVRVAASKTQELLPDYTQAVDQFKRVAEKAKRRNERVVPVSGGLPPLQVADFALYSDANSWTGGCMSNVAAIQTKELSAENTPSSGQSKTEPMAEVSAEDNLQSVAPQQVAEDLPPTSLSTNSAA